MIRIFWISMSYATFLIEATNEVITDVAPIAMWMIGKRLKDVRPWLKKKKAIGVEIKMASG